MEETKFTVTYDDKSFNGYEMLEKIVQEHGNGARVLVPRSWIGKKVQVILLEK